jgi:hypothetical protein
LNEWGNSGEYTTDRDAAILTLSVDKNGEEKSSSQRMGELHGQGEGRFLERDGVRAINILIVGLTWHQRPFKLDEEPLRPLAQGE